MDFNVVNISVTALSEYYSRSGDLSATSYGSVSGIEGTRLHQRIFKDLSKEYGDDFDCEYYLAQDYPDNDLVISVAGRADVLILGKDDFPDRIIEIKSFNSTKNSYEKLMRHEHECQVKLYGAIYLLMNGEMQSVNLTLRYVSITTLEFFENTICFDRDCAKEFFSKVCQSYSCFAKKLLSYEKESQESLPLVSFPYDTIRPGQKEFMKQTLHCLCQKQALFVEAPTGIGKTISTLYPAIKGLSKRKYGKIFYLTAKTSTREVAVKAINDMRKKGLVIRSILLESKQNMCPTMQKCDAKFCELSKGYYSRLKPALDEVLLYDDISPELISKIARKHKICPHELSLDALNYCSIAIGDYNHAFNPRGRILRCFEENNMPNAVLIDEAHNLVDRSRDMFSARFSSALLDEMIEAFKGRDKTVEKYLIRTRQYFTVVNHCLIAGQSAFVATEGVEEKKTLKSELWEGTRETPSNLYGLLWRACRFLSPILDTLEQGNTRKVAMDFFFETRFFLTILEQYYDDSYITSVSQEGEETIMCLDCLDASTKLRSQIEDMMSVVFFSATLSPYQYYKNVLLGKDADFCKSLVLPSPFPPENLDVIVDSTISTLYKDRNNTSKQLVDRILEQLEDLTGNYMIFFSSFEYEEKIVSKLIEAFEALSTSDGVKRAVVRQKREMTKTDKQSFLDAFCEPSKGLLLGCAVLGGQFGEGIDLVGDKLSGVIIVGVGIPKITPERQLLSNYYSEKFGDGYAFAYRFPGWEKVLQAVGRVIRTEEDTGFALLIDDRLEKPEYISLYPEHWNTDYN